MKIPSIENALARLESSPEIARQFDAASAGKTRRQAVTDCIARLVKISDEKLRLKSEIATAKAKVAAFKSRTPAKAVTVAKNNVTPQFMNTPIKPSPTPTPVPGTISASQFATPALRMARAEFEKLSASDKARFVKQSGQLV